MAHHADQTLIEIAGQIRSTAADLIRASQAAAPDEIAPAEASTEEMLADPRHPGPRPPGDVARGLTRRGGVAPPVASGDHRRGTCICVLMGRGAV